MALMPFRVQVGPAQISVHEGHTVLITVPDSQIRWPSEQPDRWLLENRAVVNAKIRTGIDQLDRGEGSNREIQVDSRIDEH
jgi:hypothetical protein